MPGGTAATPSCLTTIYSHWKPETATRLDDLLRDRLQKSLRATLHMARRRGSGDPPGEPVLDINIAEPAVFIPTYTNNPAVLRGTCTLELKESLVVKRLMVNFRGVSHVLWPHGFREKRTITNCKFTVFDPEKAGARETRCNSCGSTDSENLPVVGDAPSQKRCKLWYALMGRMQRGRESESRRLSPGTYTYEFEMILPIHLPETINVRRSHVNYNIRACVTTSGLWNRKITRDKQITAVHCPAENFVDDAEPVYITRTWRKLLRCEIIISRRGAALGRTLPLTVSFAELNMAKVRGLQIYLLENVQYLGRSGTVSCLGPYKRVRIYEAMDDLVPAVSRRSSADDSHPSDEEREDLFGKEKDPERMAKPTGMEGTTLEIDLPLPVCMVHSNEPRGMQNKTMHFDTRYKNVHVHHWFEFVFFASKNGSSDTPPVQKSTKVPFLLRSCFAHQANASLPAYTQTHNGKQSCTDCLIEYTE